MRETKLKKISDSSFRVTYYPNEFSKAKDRKNKYFHNEQEAVAFVQLIEAKRIKEQQEEPQPLFCKKKETIGYLASVHYRDLEGRIKPHSIAKITSDLNRHLVKNRKFMRIRDFCKWDYLQSYRNKILSKRWKSDTKNHLFSHIVQMFESGVNNELVTEKEFHLIRKAFAKIRIDDEEAKKEEEKKRKPKLEERQLREMLIALKNECSPWYVLFALQTFLGLRVGEMRALRLSDYDPDKKTISINKQAIFLNGKTVITSPKTRTSYRVIALSDKVDELVKEYIKEFSIIDPKSYLFFNQRYPISSTTINRKLHYYLKKYNLPDASFHTLRHISETRSLSQHLDTQEIAQIGERYGHRVSTSLDTYLYIQAKKSEKVVNALDDTIFKPDANTTPNT